MVVSEGPLRRLPFSWDMENEEATMKTWFQVEHQQVQNFYNCGKNEAWGAAQREPVRLQSCEQ